MATEITNEKSAPEAFQVPEDAINTALTAVMMVDKDLKITFANKATISMLTEHEATLQKSFPNFQVKNLVGSNIDMFHKHPEHQRRLLADPSNLPHRAEIKLGPLSFKLNVSALMRNGEHYGSMLEWTDITSEKLALAETNSQLDAISKAMAVISFHPDGTIIEANENFLNASGYNLDEIAGKHHRMFVGPEYGRSPEYMKFWNDLADGQVQIGEYQRFKKDGSELWLQASYNPIFDLQGKVVKVIKYASDVTKNKQDRANFEGQIDAINKAMAVISFNMDGIITDVNDNFLQAVGYSRGEVVGKHHRMFVQQDEANSYEYKAFWEKLNHGEFVGGEFQRVGNGGKELWLQATYNPILDVNGKPNRVVKYASDITAQKKLQMDVDRVLQSVTLVMNAMSKGDLTELMSGEFEGEFADFQSTVNSTVEKIASIVEEINETCVSLASAASEISQGNMDLSQRTEEQASSLQETASSMEELTSTVQQNSENTRQAEQLAASAREQAEKGGDVLKAAIEAMSQINASSKKVADIIGVIDEIAFQTNLLALNAAVEAARAGEQGRGFAVVAAEVRNLAQRSATAAKEIKGLINDSGEKVTEGSKLVNQSGATLEEIVISAKKVGDIISEIAAASEEQSSGIGQVNKAVSQMDEMTQQNASLVEQAAAASKSMDEQTQDMRSRLSFFYTGEVEPEPVAPVRRQARVASRPASRPVTQREAPRQRPVKPAPAQHNDDEWEEF